MVSLVSASFPWRASCQLGIHLHHWTRVSICQIFHWSHTNQLILLFPRDDLAKPRWFIDLFRRRGFEIGHSFYYEESSDSAYCHTCVTAFKEKKIRSPHADAAFVSLYKLILVAIICCARINHDVRYVVFKVSLTRRNLQHLQFLTLKDTLQSYLLLKEIYWCR